MLDIVAERGYGDSVGLPGFGTENDELTSSGKGLDRAPLLLQKGLKTIFLGFNFSIFNFFPIFA